MVEIICFIVGVVTGAVLVRYGLGLGVRIVEQTQENAPVFGERAEPTDQAMTDGTTDEEMEEVLE